MVSSVMFSIQVVMRYRGPTSEQRKRFFTISLRDSPDHNRKITNARIKGFPVNLWFEVNLSILRLSAELASLPIFGIGDQLMHGFFFSLLFHNLFHCRSPARFTYLFDSHPQVTIISVDRRRHLF